MSPLVEFLLARIAEDEESGAFDSATARKARLVVKAAVITRYPMSEWHVRSLGERWADHPDYDEVWRPSGA
jgi:hypothetical protein